MDADWKRFLCGRGAAIEQDRVTSFTDIATDARAAMSGNTICDLSHYGAIQVTGDDADTFLQGQLTNDVRQLSATHSQLSGYCSPKGRLLAVLRLLRSAAGVLMWLPADRLQPVLQRLNKFVLRADVRLRDASDDLQHIGLSGPDCATLLTATGLPPPGAIDEVSENTAATVVRIAGPQPRFEIHGQRPELERLWTTLEAATPVGSAAWGLLDVLAGIPEIHTATADLFIPQMIDLPRLNGVSFTKGCYTGQEIVARTQYLGKLKRRMVRATATTASCPEPGEALVAEASDQSNELGKVVLAHPGPEGQCEMLAVIQNAVPDGAILRLSHGNSPAVVVKDLPAVSASG